MLHRQRVMSGRVVAIHGGVVDVRFTGEVPAMNELLFANKLPMEVSSSPSSDTVRCMALGNTQGLGLAASVERTGAPIQVPVGNTVLGRMLNLFGEPLDKRPPLDDAPRRCIHQSPPPLEEESRTTRGLRRTALPSHAP